MKKHVRLENSLLFFVGKLLLYLFPVFLTIPLNAQENNKRSFKGTIVDKETGAPLAGVSLVSSAARTLGATKKDGTFLISVPNGETEIIISHIGYTTDTLKLSSLIKQDPTIELTKSNFYLEEIEVSTGYQFIPKERATGSFEHLNEDQITSTVSTNILQRLEGKVAGIRFESPGSNQMNIRGRNTIYSNDQPLIVVDNFPYEGDINQINPNDVENITILKDAAAASIWGARAGNGVIVITTKKGKKNQKPRINYRANLSFQGKPDFYNMSVMRSDDFIELEKYLFAQGHYKALETHALHPPFTPVVELLMAKRDGLISAAEADGKIEAMKQFDIRDDFSKYLYRNALNQQHALSITGGSSDMTWYFGAGYDKNRANQVGSDDSRISLRANNTFEIRPKLKLSTKLVFTQSIAKALPVSLSYWNYNLGAGKNLYPYARLADDNGNPAVLPKDLSSAFKQHALEDGLLDWSFKPLEETQTGGEHEVKTTDYLVNPSLMYTPFPGLILSANYQFERMVGDTRRLVSEDAYEARSLINRYTQVEAPGSVTRPIPEGGILSMDNNEIRSHQFRGQVSYEYQASTLHSFSGIAGFEIRDRHSTSNSGRFYGYNERGLGLSTVDYTTRFRNYDIPLRRLIPNGIGLSDNVTRFLSYFANGAYSYKKRYAISLSGRIDKSNMFGVKTNQRMIPLWSTGFSWIASDEPFFNWDFLSKLKLRATYGYNGNVSEEVGITTISFSSAYLTGARQARIASPPNDNLRWEKSRMMNFGIDFQTRNGVLSGSLEYYNKKNTDLLSRSMIDPTAGLGNLQGESSYVGNVASIRGEGIDITLNSTILQNENIQWKTRLIFSVAEHEVTEYFAEQSLAKDYVNGNSVISPRIGYPVYAIYSYPWGGLDPNAGHPLGILDGKTTTEYNEIMNGGFDQLVYSGPAKAPIFGAFGTRLAYKNFEFHINLAYRFGYYYKRRSIGYSALINSWNGHGDYDLRWRRPGDETITNVPAFQYPADGTSDTYYAHSETLVEQGDHIRIQNMSFSWNLDPKGISLRGIRGLNLNLYASNLGYLWVANSRNAAPFAENRPKPAVSFALGINLIF